MEFEVGQAVRVKSAEEISEMIFRWRRRHSFSDVTDEEIRDMVSEHLRYNEGRYCGEVHTVDRVLRVGTRTHGVELSGIEMWFRPEFLEPVSTEDEEPKELSAEAWLRAALGE